MPIVLITGVTAGIGEAAARAFAGAGWKVIGTGRRADRLKKLRAELGDALHTLEFDIRNQKSEPVMSMRLANLVELRDPALPLTEAAE